MLTLTIGPVELYDSVNNKFEDVPSLGVYHFEHSLKAIAEWESIYRIPFLEDNEKSPDMMLSYFQCMCLEDIDTRLMTDKVVNAITNYLSVSPSATNIKNTSRPVNQGTYTSSELIYALMTEAGIPFECDQWNLYRLINLLTIIQQRRSPEKKKSEREILMEQHELNERRKKELHSKG